MHKMIGATLFSWVIIIGNDNHKNSLLANIDNSN